MSMLCDVYKSHRYPEMYIYVARSDGLGRVPDELLTRFGEPIIALTVVLSSERRLAKEDPSKVLQNLHQQGFHLQLPPSSLDYTNRLTRP